MIDYGSLVKLLLTYLAEYS